MTALDDASKMFIVSLKGLPYGGESACVHHLAAAHVARTFNNSAP